uniref:Uncharacterized protein n=3 Tax=unclassified Prevotella TaxID=2638335 RepID=A0AB33IXJ9_9BACT
MNKIYCGYVFALLLTIGLPLLAGVLAQGNYPALLVLVCLFMGLIAVFYQLYTVVYAVRRGEWINVLMIAIGIVVSAVTGFFLFCIELLADFYPAS